MSEVKVAKLPSCNLCSGKAKYDAPTTRGAWAYMCKECAKTNMKKGWMTNPKLTTFVVHKSPPAKDKTVNGAELCSMEDIMTDCDREIGCPECNDVRIVEPDADYTYKCEGCGVQVKCPPSIC